MTVYTSKSEQACPNLVLSANMQNDYRYQAALKGVP